MINSKKVYIKAYTRLNVGDDLFVFILCSRYPNTQFYIKELTGYTDVFKNIHNLTILNDIATISFDVIVYIGGSIFIESSPTSISRLYELKKEIIKEDIPTYIIGANFGPYTSDAYFSAAKNDLLPFITSITFRDKYSYNLFKEKNNVHYAFDVVFSMDTQNIAKEDSKEIGISLIHHLDRENLKLHYDDYINKLVEISRYYINLGYTVRLFSFCEYEKDMIAIYDMLNKLHKNELKHVVITNYTGNIHEVLSKIANLKLFITSRFHAMILGLKFSIPIIPICYSSKCMNVLTDINYPIQKIYTFESLDNLNYINMPQVFLADFFNDATLQFKDLDVLLN